MDDRVPELKPYDPTIRERLSSGLQSGLEALGMKRYGARRAAQTVTGGPSSNLPLGMGAADFVPFVGTGLQTEEAARDLGKAYESAKKGDYVDAAVEGGFGLLGMVPGVAATAKTMRAAGKTAPKAVPKVEAAPKLNITKPEALKPMAAPDQPKLKGKYETTQEGPYYRVRPTGDEASGRRPVGIHEEVRPAPEGGSGSVGSELPQSVSDEQIREMMADPGNFVRKTADDYAQRYTGSPYDLPKIPESSLAKQSAIGRTFQLAAEDDPKYKSAVFDAYAKKYPDLVESTGAQNYDQLMEAAYRQLAMETEKQFRSLPINMSYHRQGEGNYTSSGQMLKDIYGNRHMYVYQGGDPHDFLNAIDPQTGLNTNEMFRAVHDFYGHAIHGNQFGPKGEEVAWAAHSKMFSPLARIAMTSETRGQNSFVNYTPLNAELKAQISKLDEAIMDAKRHRRADDVKMLEDAKKDVWAEFQFAPQKSVILPPEYLDLDYRGGMPSYVQPLIKPEAGTTAASQLTHFSHSPDIEIIDPSRYGTGIKGREMERLTGSMNPVMERSYFYTGEPGSVRPEPGLGIHRYGARSEGLYDVSADPLGFRTLATEANRTPFTAKYNQGITDPTQSFTDVERMAKEYGYEGLMNPQQGTAIMYKPTPVQRYSWGGVVQQPQGVVSPYNTTPDMSDGGRIYPDNELNNYAAGGLAHFDKGGAVKTKIKDLMKKVLNEQGSFEAKRLERAADEVPNLESLYQQEALERLFRGDNARALMTMNPKDFEKFSQPLDPRFMDESSTRYTKTGERMSFPEYMTEYLPNVGAFSDVPFLEINKQKQGSKSAPFISGHEGRHRNRVMADRGETAGLVQLLPRSELREPFPRRSREEYIEALTKELDLTGGMVLPERFEDQSSVIRRRPAIKLPKVYAEGGEAHFDKGGAAKKEVKEWLRGAIDSLTKKFADDASKANSKPIATESVIASTISKSADEIAKANPKLSEAEIAKKAERDALAKLKWERQEKPAIESRYGKLARSSYDDPRAKRLRNVPEVVEERARKAEEFLAQPTEPWTPPKPELQAFDRSLIKDALEGFPGVEQSRFPRYEPARADTGYIDEIYNDPRNRALIEKQIKRGLPLGGETFYASLYPLKVAAMERGIPASKFESFVYETAPASARNSIMNEMAVGQFLRDMNARGLPLDEKTVAEEMAKFKSQYGTGLPLMPVHREGVRQVIEGGQNMRDMVKADIPTNYKIPTYGTQKAGDFGKSMVLDVHESAGQTQGSRYHPYFTEQGGFGPTEYGLAESKMLDIANDMGIPGGMAQAGRWFGGGELTGLKSPRGDALDLLERQAAYTMQGLGIKPTPKMIREYILDMIESGRGVLMPYYKSEAIPDYRTQKKKGGAVRSGLSALEHARA